MVGGESGVGRRTVGISKRSGGSRACTAISRRGAGRPSCRGCCSGVLAAAAEAPSPRSEARALGFSMPADDGLRRSERICESV